MGPWLKSEAPALQAVLSGSVTRRTPPFHCGENEIQASLISSASVGATPTAYKNIEAVIQDLVDAGLVSVTATFRPLLTYKMRKTRR